MISWILNQKKDTHTHTQRKSERCRTFSVCQVGHLFGKDWQGNSAVRITASPKRRHHWRLGGRDASWQNCHSKLGPSQRWDLVGQEAEIWRNLAQEWCWCWASDCQERRHTPSLFIPFPSFPFVGKNKQFTPKNKDAYIASQQFEREESGLPKCCQDPSICSFVKLEQDSLMPCDVVEKWGRKMIVPSQHSKDW